MATVTLRYWAAAKDAAGIDEQKVEAADLAAALAAGIAQASESDPGGDRAERLRGVLARCSFLIDDQPAGKRAPESVKLADGTVVEVLPPFAGG